jgi:hypothetical protein
MTEEQLRALVREEVAKHLGVARSTSPAAAGQFRADPSHARFNLPTVEGSACLIEPAVLCNHCGYCKSYGH